jgi:hypothetical protein
MPSIVSSDRIITAVIDPLFEHIYEDELYTPDARFLDLSVAQLVRVRHALELLKPLMKVTISANRLLQPRVLSRLQTLLAQRGFEPKGLCFEWFSFLYQSGVLHDSAFNQYLSDTRSVSPGRNSVLLEINSFLLTVITPSFPDSVAPPGAGRPDPSRPRV